MSRSVCRDIRPGTCSQHSWVRVPVPAPGARGSPSRRLPRPCFTGSGEKLPCARASRPVLGDFPLDGPASIPCVLPAGRLGERK